MSLVVLLAALCGAYELNKSDQPPTAADGGDAHETCESDWHVCKSAEDLIEHNRKVSFYRASCKIKANETAEYGPPEWQKGFGIYPFSSYFAGDDIKALGIVLIEDHALVPNKFGGKERSRISCHYDLAKDEVSEVMITPLASMR
ncbi:hypothetical protein AA0535_1669 [Asaia krungthepensis NRIC 0535]|uniref:Uncharacterized protein n=1 Tax=Asaia krungthepensis NRIC 0535 TaxID=1307925 RepID=A0ABQ0Q308_9PROT|nr:hypothetical protein AA0535_1669 [Asaia krungthepensis NRIC 0535]